MAKNATINQLVTVYRLIGDAKLSKMEDHEKFSFIKKIRKLRKIGMDFDELLKDAQEKLKPEGFDRIVEKVQNNIVLTAEDTAVYDKYQKAVSDCMQDEITKKVDIDFEPFSSEALDRFFASNDFTVNETMAILDVLGE